MSLYLHGIGTAVPEHFIGQHDACGMAQALVPISTAQQAVLARLYQRAGVETRHSVVLQTSTNSVPARQDFYTPAAPGEETGPTTAERMRRYAGSASSLGVSAAMQALARAGIEAGRVTHLVTVSCTGFDAPGVDVALMRELGLPAGTARTHLGFMGCHAALNGLRVARAFAEADANSCVLLCAVELCSLHYQYTGRPDQIVSNSLFADGAAAVIASAQPGTTTGWNLISSASHVIADSEEEMGWRIGDHGFEMTLSPRVPNLIRESFRSWIDGWLRGQGLSVAEIARWAIHPGGPRILSACQDACGLGRDDLQASTDVLAAYGNMSSPTVLFILDRLQQQSPAAPCVALAFGPGLTIEAALFG